MREVLDTSYSSASCPFRFSENLALKFDELISRINFVLNTLICHLDYRVPQLMNAYKHILCKVNVFFPLYNQRRKQLFARLRQVSYSTRIVQVANFTFASPAGR